MPRATMTITTTGIEAVAVIIDDFKTEYVIEARYTTKSIAPIIAENFPIIFLFF
jgi:hypothetical protein